MIVFSQCLPFLGSALPYRITAMTRVVAKRHLIPGECVMKPEKVIRFGAVSASVFANEIVSDRGNKTIRNVKLQRRFKSGDQWKTSSSFSLGELPTAIAILQRALEYVASMESDAEEN